MTDNTIEDEFDEMAGVLLMRRLTLAQLDHNRAALKVVVDEICDAGPGYLWLIASLLSAAVSHMIVHFSGGDRAAAARKAAKDPLSGMVPSVAAAQRLVRAWFEDPPNALRAVLDDIERQGLLVDAVISVNGMLVGAMVGLHNGDRGAAAQRAADLLAGTLDGTVSGREF
jgi:hypothetical protein